MGGWVGGTDLEEAHGGFAEVEDVQGRPVGEELFGKGGVVPGLHAVFA